MGPREGADVTGARGPGSGTGGPAEAPVAAGVQPPPSACPSLQARRRGLGFTLCKSSALYFEQTRRLTEPVPRSEAAPTLPLKRLRRGVRCFRLAPPVCTETSPRITGPCPYRRVLRAGGSFQGRGPAALARALWLWPPGDERRSPGGWAVATASRPRSPAASQGERHHAGAGPHLLRGAQRFREDSAARAETQRQKRSRHGGEQEGIRAVLLRAARARGGRRGDGRGPGSQPVRPAWQQPQSLAEAVGSDGESAEWRGSRVPVPGGPSCYGEITTPALRGGVP